MNHTVQLYALSTCGWCKKTHFFLEDHNIDHDIIAVDLLDDKEKEMARKKLGTFNPRKSYPTVIIDNKKAVVGFEEEQLKKYLNL